MVIFWKSINFNFSFGGTLLTNSCLLLLWIFFSWKNKNKISLLEATLANLLLIISFSCASLVKRERSEIIGIKIWCGWGKKGSEVLVFGFLCLFPPFCAFLLHLSLSLFRLLKSPSKNHLLPNYKFYNWKRNPSDYYKRN